MKKYYLMAPGPTPVPSNVLLAMARPMIHHWTPEYEALFIEVRAGLKRLFQTSQDVTPVPASGTGALEAAVVNTLSAGDTALVLRAGKFGERWDEICRTYGITVIPLDAPFRHTVPAEAFEQALRAHPEAKAVLMQHSESSTGVLHDVRGIAAVTRDTGAILVVDAVSSLGIADRRMGVCVVRCWGTRHRRPARGRLGRGRGGGRVPEGADAAAGSLLLGAVREGVGPREGVPAAQVLLRHRHRAEVRGPQRVPLHARGLHLRGAARSAEDDRDRDAARRVPPSRAAGPGDARRGGRPRPRAVRAGPAHPPAHPGRRPAP